jgi:hypothetical protein
MGSSSGTGSGSGKKRPREEGSSRDGGRPSSAAGGGSSGGARPPAREQATVGQQTSHIKNKLVRAEAYSKLKHTQKVRWGWRGVCRERRARACRGLVPSPSHAMLLPCNDGAKPLTCYVAMQPR